MNNLTHKATHIREKRPLCLAHAALFLNCGLKRDLRKKIGINLHHLFFYEFRKSKFTYVVVVLNFKFFRVFATHPMFMEKGAYSSPGLQFCTTIQKTKELACFPNSLALSLSVLCSTSFFLK